MFQDVWARTSGAMGQTLWSGSQLCTFGCSCPCPLASVYLMSRFLALAIFLCAACAANRRAESVSDVPSLAFKHVNIVDVQSGRVLADQILLIAGNRIQAVGPTRRIRIPSGAQVVEAGGGYLIPGLWDMHVHAGSADDFASQIENRFPLLVAHGVTGVRNHHSTAPLERWIEIRREVETGERLGPRLILSGPMLDGPIPLIRPGAVSVSNAEDVRLAVDMLLRGGADYINISPTLPRNLYIVLAEAARQRDVAFVGPVPVAVSLTEASELGQESIEHLSPIPESCSPRSSEFHAARRDVFYARARGKNVSALIAHKDSLQRLILHTYSDNLCQDLFRRFVYNQTWVVPTLVVERTNALTFEARFQEDSHRRYIPAMEWTQWEAARARAIQRTGAEERALARAVFNQRVGVAAAMQRAGVGLLAGTDIPTSFLVPGLSLHEELELLVAAGLTPLEALRTATLNPARYLEATDSLGTIQVGKLADLVLLSANPLEDITNTQRIVAVVLNGHYLNRRALDELLAAAERAANSRQN